MPETVSTITTSVNNIVKINTSINNINLINETIAGREGLILV